jgi:flagellar motor switch protein FliG
MAVIDHKSLSKTQKLAAFLIIIGPECAADLIKQLPDPELENIAREMAALEIIDFDLQEKITDEFCELIGDGLSSVLGGVNYAHRTLERAKGPQMASNILQKAMPPSNSLEIVREFSQMEARQVFNLIKTEQPQTIAFILSYLDTGKVAEVVTLLPATMREEVVERLGSMEAISSEMVAKVLRNLSKHAEGGSRRHTLHKRGGVQAAAQLMNALDKEIGKALITRLEERNAPLGEAIRKKMFSFEDMAKLAARDVQRIMRDVEMADVAIAMKASKDAVRNTIYGAMSKRAADTLREEISMLGPMRLKEVEAAQDRIIAIVRTLEESGEITLGGEGGNDMV